MVLKVDTKMPGFNLVTSYVRKCIRHCGYPRGQFIPLQETEHLEGQSDNKISGSCCGCYAVKRPWKGFSETVFRLRPNERQEVAS